MNALRRDAGAGATALYLRLPARTEAPAAVRSDLAPNSAQSFSLSFALPFALTVRGSLREQGIATLQALSEQVQRAQRVILLLAASDVTVVRVAVPPMPAHRLKQALPALVEDRLIGDPADCVLAAGAADDGLRTVAVVDRTWLEQWAARLRRMGARRLSALPLQLCLPLPAGRVAAAVVDSPLQSPPSPPSLPSRELVLRLGSGEGAGLPLGEVSSDTASPAEVLRAVAALCGGQPVQLSVPEDELARFADALDALAAQSPQPTVLPDAELRVASWSDLTEGAQQSAIDLLAGASADTTSAIDWRRWRLPLALALVVLLLNLFALNWDWWRLHREGSRLQAEMLRVYRAAFPDDSASDQVVMEDPLARMKQRRITQRRASGEPSPGDFLSLSASLGAAWPALQQATGLTARAVESITYRDAALALRLRPGSQPSVDVVRKLLAERHLVLEEGSTATDWRVRSAS